LGQRSVCLASNSLSLNLVGDFLAAEQISVQLKPPMDWRFGPVTLLSLPPRFGSYQHLGGLLSQTMINYRALAPGDAPGQRVTLQEVLEDRIQSNWVRDRVVMIGTTAPVGKDLRMTPSGQIPGVWIHGHLVSQLLSSILDRRPLIQGLPQLDRDWGSVQWGDGLWIWVWTTWGCWMVWRLPRRIGWAVVLIGAIGLYQICLLALVQGIWLPWVPTSLSLGIGAVSLYIRRVWVLDRSKTRDRSPDLAPTSRDPIPAASTASSNRD
jgi:CHASE2 domain-containing sensor protein